MNCGTMHFIKPMSIQLTIASHTNERYTGKRIAKLSIRIKHFRNNPLIGERFPGENQFLVFFVQRIILLSGFIVFNHDWNGSIIVLWLGCFTFPVCAGLR